MKKYGPFLTLFLFLAFAPAAWGQTESGTMTDDDAASYDAGTGGAAQPEMAPIAYPPEMAEPVPVYSSDPNAPSSPAEASGKSETPSPSTASPVIDQTIVIHGTEAYRPASPIHRKDKDDSAETSPQTESSNVKAAPNNKAVNSPAADAIEKNRERIQDIAKKRIEERDEFQGREPSSSTTDDSK